MKKPLLIYILQTIPFFFCTLLCIPLLRLEKPNLLYMFNELI